MDVVLEVFDTYLFDQLYAAALPASPAGAFYNALGEKSVNASIAGLQDAAALGAAKWQYEPATEWIFLTPGDHAYMSQWSRDNAWRQTLSLYLITTYASSLPSQYQSRRILRSEYQRHALIPRPL